MLSRASCTDRHPKLAEGKEVAHSHTASVRKRVRLATDGAEPLSQLSEHTPECGQGNVEAKAVNSPSDLGSQQHASPFSGQGIESLQGLSHSSVTMGKQRCLRSSKGQLDSQRLSAGREGSSRGWGRNVPVQRPVEMSGRGLHGLKMIRPCETPG